MVHWPQWISLHANFMGTSYISVIGLLITCFLHILHITYHLSVDCMYIYMYHLLLYCHKQEDQWFGANPNLVLDFDSNMELRPLTVLVYAMVDESSNELYSANGLTCYLRLKNTDSDSRFNSTSTDLKLSQNLIPIEVLELHIYLVWIWLSDKDYSSANNS